MGNFLRLVHIKYPKNTDYDKLDVMDTDQKIKEAEELLSRGVGQFIDPGDGFRKKLIGKIKGEYTKDIVVKFGVDPTKPDIHLGHAVALRKMRKFLDLGCKVVFVIGDFTASIGDPTGKTKTRPNLSDKNNGTAGVLDAGEAVSEEEEVPGSDQIIKNTQTYLEQVNKIISNNSPGFYWVKNSDWFMSVTDMNYGPKAKANINITENGKTKTISINPNSFLGKALLFEETRMQKKDLKSKGIINVTMRGLLWTLQHITHSRLLERDMFQERISAGRELYMHELIYPVLQGIDSFVLSGIFGSCDLEIGGTDQTFNMLLGRDVMEINKKEPQSVITFELLPGIDGKEKMSKSLNNYVSIIDKPTDMFGKIMSIPDETIPVYFELCTYTSPEEIGQIKKDCTEGVINPRDVKARLAKEVVSIYHGEESAVEAESNFNAAFKEGGVPKDVDTLSVPRDSSLADILLERGIVKSKSEWRRLVSEGAVKDMETGDKVSDSDIRIEKTSILKIGKKRFLKVEVK